MAELGYTQGSGAEIRTDQGSTTGAHMQIIKLAEGTTGSENFIPATVSNGLLVEVSKVDTAVPVTGTVLVEPAETFDVTVTVVEGTVTVAGSVSVSGTAAVSGTVTTNQGSPASDANAWPVLLSNGAENAHLTEVGSNYALDVNLTQSITPEGVQADKTGFTEGSGMAEVAAGGYNDSP